MASVIEQILFISVSGLSYQSRAKHRTFPGNWWTWAINFFWQIKSRFWRNALFLKHCCITEGSYVGCVFSAVMIHIYFRHTLQRITCKVLCFYATLEWRLANLHLCHFVMCVLQFHDWWQLLHEQNKDRRTGHKGEKEKLISLLSYKNVGIDALNEVSDVFSRASK